VGIAHHYLAKTASILKNDHLFQQYGWIVLAIVHRFRWALPTLQVLILEITIIFTIYRLQLWYGITSDLSQKQIMNENFEELHGKRKQEALLKIRTYKKLVHSDFAWWKERERAIGERGNDYNRYLRSQSEGEPTAPPEHLLRTLDKFESLLAWLENQPIGQEMTAYEKAQVVCKLLDMTSSRDLSVSLDSDSFDVTLKGDSDYPVCTRLESGYESISLKIEKND
jgi:hypothetical protein